MARTEFPEVTLRFVGGPCDGEEVTILWQRNREAVYRSNVKGDTTIYGHPGIGMHRYYKFFSIWRWEGLDCFDHLITDQGEVSQPLTIDY
jgi:hypothetical protein